MNKDVLVPFIRSTHEVFQTMLQCTIKCTSVSEKSDHSPSFDISGVIGLSGKLSGSVVFSLSRAVSFQIVNAILGTKVDSINQDVVDAVGELTNIIAGSAKKDLNKFDLTLGLPNVVVGRNHIVSFPSWVSPVCVYFSTPWGAITVEVGLEPTPAGVAIAAAARGASAEDV